MTLDKFGRSTKGGKLKSGPPGPRGKDGEPGIGFLLTSDNNYDLQMRSIKNLQFPKEDEDGANKKYVDDSYNNCQGLCHSYIKTKLSDISIQIDGHIKEIYTHMENSTQKQRAECSRLLHDLNVELLKYVDIKVDNINTTLQGIKGLEAVVFSPKNEEKAGE